MHGKCMRIAHRVRHVGKAVKLAAALVWPGFQLSRANLCRRLEIRVSLFSLLPVFAFEERPSRSLTDSFALVNGNARIVIRIVIINMFARVYIPTCVRVCVVRITFDACVESLSLSFYVATPLCWPLRTDTTDATGCNWDAPLDASPVTKCIRYVRRTYIRIRTCLDAYTTHSSLDCFICLNKVNKFFLSFLFVKSLSSFFT